MKKIYLVLLLLLLIPLASARQTQFSNDNNLRIDLVTISPSPVSLGSSSELTFEATNMGTETINNLEFSPSSKFPLSIVDITPIMIKTLAPDESKQFKFKIKSASSADEGTYKFTLQFEEPTIQQISVASYDIQVKRIQRTIATTYVTTDPETLQPGYPAIVNVEIENNANYDMKDISVKLNFSDTVPIAPYKTTAERQIKEIKADTSEIVSFQVIALPEAEPNVYRIPLTLIFDDALGNEYKRQDYAGIIIASAPDYDLTIEDSTLIAGMPGEITVSLSNIGPANIRYLILEVLPSKEYNILNPPRTYLGNLEPDDYETSDFDFYPKKSGNINIKVRLEYKDDLNRPITTDTETTVYVYSKIYARWLGLIPGKFTMNSIIFVLFIIFLYLTYRTWRKTRDLGVAVKSALLRMLTSAVMAVRHLRWRYIKRVPRKIRLFLLSLR